MNLRGQWIARDVAVLIHVDRYGAEWVSVRTTRSDVKLIVAIPDREPITREVTAEDVER